MRNPPSFYRRTARVGTGRLDRARRLLRRTRCVRGVQDVRGPCAQAAGLVYDGPDAHAHGWAGREPRSSSGCFESTAVRGASSVVAEMVAEREGGGVTMMMIPPSQG